MQDQAAKSVQALTPRQDLYEIFANSEYSLKKKKKIIDALDDIDGFELAFLISFILSIDITGHLNIISKDNEVIGISFSRGFITHIDLPDKQTYFGTLMVEMGYIQVKDLEVALKNTEIHIGQYFLQQKKVTQAQIDLTFRKQMELRLTKLICDNTYNINFADASETPLFIKITRRDYYEMCYSWLESRITKRWLEEHFKLWEKDLVIFLDGHTYIADAFKKPMLLQLPEFSQEIRKGMSLRRLKNLYRDHEDAFLKSLYFLTVIGVVVFKESPELEKVAKLQTIFEQLKGKKGNELAKGLAELTKIPVQQSESVYLAFQKLISENADDESQEYQNNLVKIGIDFLSQQSAEPYSETSAAPRSQMEKNIASNSMAAIQKDLLKGKYFEAFSQLKKTFASNDLRPSMKVYLLWAKIGHALNANLKVNLMNFENELADLVHEDKETAEFEYVQSMLAILKKDKEKSKLHFENAVRKKPVFLKYPVEKGVWAKFISAIGLNT